MAFRVLCPIAPAVTGMAVPIDCFGKFVECACACLAFPGHHGTIHNHDYDVQRLIGEGGQ
jgi:hypothetical protein